MTEDLAGLEALIRDDEGDFETRGRALKLVRDQRLYRGRVPHFETYLTEHLGLSRTNAFYLMGCFDVCQTLHRHCPELPAPNVAAHARMLIGLPPKTQAAIWRRVCAAAETEKLTVKLIKQIVDEQSQYQAAGFEAPPPMIYGRTWENGPGANCLHHNAEQTISFLIDLNCQLQTAFNELMVKSRELERRNYELQRELAASRQVTVTG